jgi:arsenite/tail-anchored protein-transporting ATPase
MIFLFAGKGGVGKTTCAAVSALHHASHGKRTLAISTDATPSLSHIFEIPHKFNLSKVQEDLYISELGVQEVKEMWDTKFGAEVYEVFSSFVSIEYEDFLEFMVSILPGLFDEFIINYIRELYLANQYETIVWDTAPLGQTLALLQTPALLMRHLRMAPRIYSKLKRGQEKKESLMAIIDGWQKLSKVNMDFLRNEVNITMVTIPEALAVQQLDGIFAELTKFELPVKKIIVNNVVKAPDSNFLITKAEEQSKYLHYIHKTFGFITITELPMFPHQLHGLKRLSEVAESLFKPSSSK